MLRYYSGNLAFFIRTDFFVEKNMHITFYPILIRACGRGRVAVENNCCSKYVTLIILCHYYFYYKLIFADGLSDFFLKQNYLFHRQRCRCWYKRFTFSFIISIIFTFILARIIVINDIIIIIIIVIIIIIEGIISPQFLGTLFCTSINVLFYFKSIFFF